MIAWVQVMCVTDVIELWRVVFVCVCLLAEVWAVYVSLCLHNAAEGGELNQ